MTKYHVKKQSESKLDLLYVTVPVTHPLTIKYVVHKIFFYI